ncbi:endonuclease/exonuclease/phosphatase family protein [Flavivirga spongiicola]|uniref:Endonuclease/exonuclease/phosphatase family protein n=1 Tax=Flavivirga spongiicola TaxID=421621 RepID=A0ABU7XT99_9FLAO|nr:endonuclease/exonuclease/phosphatase family protein [Flavivirga sp. MEBiC05379]MDO5979015.1 endonuclease/exonuclease/phosphatase family protein [Flavivirga sp. MEBiC05379]
MNNIFRYKTLSLLIIAVLFNVSCRAADEKLENTPNSEPFEFKLMTWNIWGKLNLDPKYTINGKTGRDRVIEIIKESEADIITMTETYGSASDIAAALNYNYYTPSPDANLTIFSRFPLENFGRITNLSPFSFISGTVKLPNGKKIRIYNIWLTSGGRHIVEIKNKSISDKEFNNGDQNRYNHIQELLRHPDFKSDLANKDETPVIVAGDFNCVSHFDYTQETKGNGLNYSRILANKTSLAMKETGFIDSYRFIHPNITKETLGYTWTTVGQGYTYISGQGFIPVNVNPHPKYQDPYARIDFIYSAGKKIKPIKSRTIKHHSSNTIRSFPEFPSDHSALLTTFLIE